MKELMEVNITNKVTGERISFKKVQEFHRIPITICINPSKEILLAEDIDDDLEFEVQTKEVELTKSGNYLYISEEPEEDKLSRIYPTNEYFDNFFHNSNLSSKFLCEDSFQKELSEVIKSINPINLEDLYNIELYQGRNPNNPIEVKGLSIDGLSSTVDIINKPQASMIFLLKQVIPIFEDLLVSAPRKQKNTNSISRSQIMNYSKEWSFQGTKHQSRITFGLSWT